MADTLIDFSNELAGIAIGAKYKSGTDLVTEVRKVIVEQGSFAHPWFRDQRQETPITFGSIYQRSERLPVRRS